MRVCIFSGGTIAYEVVQRELPRLCPDAIIAADRGLGFLDAHGITPDYIVGDFDSLDLQNGVLKKYREAGTVPIDTFQPEKDMTDTDIALEKAIALGADEVIFFGATGSRFDHSLSNIYDLYKLYQRGIEGVLLDAHNRIRMPLGTEVSIRREEQYGRFVSIFPFRGPVTGLTLDGFKYPLTDHTLTLGDGGLTVSNEITENEGVIRWKEGTIILMETLD